MVKRYESYEKVYKGEKLVEFICDICGRKGELDGGWERSYTGVEDVTIEYQSGSRYPEGADITYHEIDMCPKCFEEKLVPWLKEQGAEIRERWAGY